MMTDEHPPSSGDTYNIHVRGPVGGIGRGTHGNAQVGVPGQAMPETTTSHPSDWLRLARRRIKELLAAAWRWLLETLRRLAPVVIMFQFVLGIGTLVTLIVAIVIGTRGSSNLDLLNTANFLGGIAYYVALGITVSEVLVFALQRKLVGLALFLIVGAVVFSLGYFVVGGLWIYLAEMCIPLAGGFMLAMPLLNLRLTRRTIPQP